MRPAYRGLKPADYDAFVMRLQWLHGPERAGAILAGQDDATERDIARWRLLGWRPPQ